MKQNACRCLFLLTFSFLSAVSVDEWRRINQDVVTQEFSSGLKERLEKLFSDLASMDRDQSWDVRYRLLLKHALDRALRHNDIEFVQNISSFAKQAQFDDLVREIELIVRAHSFDEELSSFADQFRQKGAGGTPDMLLDELSGEMRSVLEQLYNDINRLLAQPQDASLAEEFEQQERESWQSITQRIDKLLEMIEQRKEAARHSASREELGRAQQELQGLSSVVRLLQKTMGQLDDYVSSHREKIGEYKTQVNDLTRQRTMLQKQVEDIRQACQETAAESVTRREEELQNQQQRIAQLQQELEQLRGVKSENISLKQTVGQYKEKLDDLSSRQSESDVARTELSQQLAEMQSKYQECGVRLRELQEQSQKASVSPSAREHEAYAEQVRELERDNKQLRRQLQSMEEYTKTMQAEIAARGKVVAAEQQEVQREKREAKMEQARPLEEQQTKITQLRGELQKQSEELAALRAHQARLKVALDTTYDAAMQQLNFFWQGLERQHQGREFSGPLKDYHHLYDTLRGYHDAIVDIKTDGAWDFFSHKTLELKRDFVRMQLARQLRSYIEAAQEREDAQFLTDAQEQLEKLEGTQEALFEQEDMRTLQEDIVRLTGDYDTWQERYDDLLLEESE